MKARFILQMLIGVVGFTTVALSHSSCTNGNSSHAVADSAQTASIEHPDSSPDTVMLTHNSIDSTAVPTFAPDTNKHQKRRTATDDYTMPTSYSSIDIHQNLLEITTYFRKQDLNDSLPNSFCQDLIGEFQHAAYVYPRYIIDTYPNSSEKSARPDQMQAHVAIMDPRKPDKLITMYAYRVGIDKTGTYYCNFTGEVAVEKENIMDGALLQGYDSEKVYLILEGKRYWLSDPSVMANLFTVSNIKPVSQTAIKAFPEAAKIKDGYLCKGSGAEVYLVMNQTRRHIANEDVFNFYHFDWSKIRNLSDADLAMISEGKPLNFDR